MTLDHPTCSSRCTLVRSSSLQHDQPLTPTVNLQPILISGLHCNDAHPSDMHPSSPRPNRVPNIANLATHDYRPDPSPVRCSAPFGSYHQLALPTYRGIRHRIRTMGSLAHEQPRGTLTLMPRLCRTAIPLRTNHHMPTYCHSPGDG